ncbi:MAG: hypothetical protein ACLUJR_08030 [Mediterraneibacter gnavus]
MRCKMRTEKEQAMWTKAEKLTAKLTLDEKIKMVHGAELFQTKGGERLGIPPLKMSDGPMGKSVRNFIRQDGNQWGIPMIM